MGAGYTIEEQLTKQAKFGGMQIEVIPAMCDDVEVITEYGLALLFI